MKKRYIPWSYVAGATAARTGDEMSGPALLLAGLAATGSAASASALLAGLTAAAAVGGPIFGLLLDRSPAPGRLLAGALGCYAVSLAAVLLSLGRLPFAGTLLIAVFAGLLGPALAGGWTAQLPRVTPPARLRGANTLDAMTFDFAALAGPALAGGVAVLAGASTGLAVACALIGLAVPVAWTLPTGPAADPGAAGTRAAGNPSPVAELAAGFRALRRSMPLARATVTSVVSCAAGGALAVCAPLLGERVYGAAAHGTALLAGVAAAALAANALLARSPRPVRPDTLIWVAVLVLALALLLAATLRPALLVAAVVLAGAAEGPLLTALFAVRHREAPERLRAQIFTTGASLKITGFACGAALAGPVAAWSLPGALLAAAGTQVLAATAFGWITLRRRRDPLVAGRSPGPWR